MINYTINAQSYFWLAIFLALSSGNIPADTPPQISLSTVDEKLFVSFNEYLKESTPFFLSLPRHRRHLFPSRSFHPVARPSVGSVSHDLLWSGHVFAVVVPHFSYLAFFARTWVWRAPPWTTSCTKTPPSSIWWTPSHTNCCSAWLERCSVPRRSVSPVCAVTRDIYFY